MKVKVLFCEFWFKTRQGTPCYKLHFQLNSEQTAFVPSDKAYQSGSEVTLSLGRDKDGRCKVVLAR